MGRETPCESCPMERSVKSGKVESVQLTASDGRDYELISAPICNEGGTIDKVIEIVFDITERKSAEKELKAERDFIDVALNAQADTFFVFEISTGKAIRWNETFNKVSGYSNEEISSMKAPDSYYGKDDLAKAAVFIEEIIKGNKLIYNFF